MDVFYTNHKYENSNIISEFEKLVKQISRDIDNEKDTKKRITNIYRLKQIGNALSILKKYPRIIISGSDLKDIKGIGKGVINRIDEIISTGHLSEITMKKTDYEKSDYIKNIKEVYGIGEVKATELVNDYGITSVEMLKKRISKGKY